MSARLRHVEISSGPPLDAYRLVDGQRDLVDPLIARGHELAESLGTSRVWMINSTASGGGVAATLPHTCSRLRDVGVDVRWLVLEPLDSEYFRLTKRLHNLLHGSGDPTDFAAQARERFARVSEEAARALIERLEVGDVVVVHDPQPCGLASFLPDELKHRLIWRCHVGVPFHNQSTDAGWEFLTPWLEPYQRLLFTSERYSPQALKPRTTAMQPAIDPLSHKNRELSPYKLLGILRSSGVITGDVPEWTRFEACAERYLDGRFVASPIDAVLSCPIILQISRFDPLKGFEHSIAAFEELAKSGAARTRQLRVASSRSIDELERCHLVLAGPDPHGVTDDPEAAGVLADLCRRWDGLPKGIANRVHILKLPMASAKENALMVNALQRMASVIVQPSLQEGFGLTVTEALHKGVPVIGTNVGGIALQIRADLDGRVIDRANDIEEFAAAMTDSLVLVKETERMARTGQMRAAEHFLLLREVLEWVDVIHDLVAVTSAAHGSPSELSSGTERSGRPETSLRADPSDAHSVR